MQPFPSRLTGKTALVTGAASGIGRAISCRLAREGAEVFLLDLNHESAKAVADSLQEEGGAAHAIACNLALPDSIRDALAGMARVDILVNSAGVAHIGNAANTTPEEFDRVYTVNVKGVYLCLHHIIPKMIEHRGGVILNIASIASKVGIQDRFAYSMSKGAVLAMTLSVARDYVGSGIRCNCICPARIHTPFVDGFLARSYPGQEEAMFQKLSSYQPIGRMGTPDEVAALSAFLCSDEAGFITGSAYDLDGGVTLLR